MSEIKQRTKNKIVKIKDLKPYIKNPYNHTSEQVEEIEYSIGSFGYITPIIVWKNNEIIAGHKRYYALKKMANPGASIPVVDASYLSDKKAQQYRIMENESRKGEIDVEKMDSEINDIFDHAEDQTQNIFNETGIDFDSLQRAVNDTLKGVKDPGGSGSAPVRTHSKTTAQMTIKYDRKTFDLVDNLCKKIMKRESIQSKSDAIFYALKLAGK